MGAEFGHYRLTQKCTEVYESAKEVTNAVVWWLSLGWRGTNDTGTRWYAVLKYLKILASSNETTNDTGTRWYAVLEYSVKLLVDNKKEMTVGDGLERGGMQVV